VIVPNSPHYFLTREMGEQSASLIRRHHQMNGWELLRLTIRPQYALWTVNLPVSIDPVKVVEEIKAETSELLLSAHSDEMQTQEGQSFWAAGYWILSGQHPPSGNLIRQFLKFNDRKSAEESGVAN
jgi:REP element-mobilizing transposase RayT